MVLPLEQAAAAAVLNNVMGRLFEALGLGQAYKMLKDLEPESESLLQDLRMLAAAVDDELTGSRGARRTAVARAYSREMRALTHDVEDSIERFVHRVARDGVEGASWLRRAAHRACALRTCYRFAAEIKRLKKRVQEASARVLRPPEGQLPGARRRAADHAARRPVGIGKPMEVLLALLDLDQEKGQPRVIAVVGFGGVGKTTLARAVYHAAPVADAFPCRAWVAVRSPEDGDVAGILENIHQLLLPGQQYSESSLTKYLKDKRYLIVIDDVDDIEEEQWDIITSAFEENREGSRIVVTTTFRATANRRSNANGCVYKMRTLGMRDSMTIALGGRCTAELMQGSETLLKKCGGLPLALVSVARQLSGEDEPTGQFCSELCSKLGSYLEREDGEPNFARLRDVLMDSYTSLSDLTVRTCLLYLGIFPNDRPLRKNVIIRRWLAEGYARSEDITLSEQSVANGNFKTLIDRNIVLPVKTRKNAEVKMCKTHGIMHEFLLHRAMCEKFILCSHTPSDQIVRHLFVHDDVNDTQSKMTFKTDLSRVRSLTVRGNAGVAISDFGRYKLMRVLDLEECTDVNDRHVRKICKLWNLRYLSLGRNVTNLPKEIAKLKLLETLVLSKTVVNVLPVEVIGIPCLTNLIGKFKLSDQDCTSNSNMERLSKNEGLEDLFRKSKLETLAGFVGDGSHMQGFLQLMVHMKNLKKVKIWCESAADIEGNDHLNAELVKAIRQYIKTPMGAGDVRSLSIDFQGVPGGSLNALQELCRHSTSLQETYYLSSLKLHGNLSTYPEFVGIFSRLTELCLSCTTVSTDLLFAISAMPFLLYLKLIVDEIDGFVIKGGTYQSLRRLCFLVRHQNPVLPEIEEGALPELVSLQLLCEHLAGPSGIKIRHLRMLQEIELHPEISEPARQEWEEAARNHPNRPIVLPFVNVNDLVENDNEKNPVASPEESRHEGGEAPRPSCVQHMPLSTCNNSGLSSEMDDAVHHDPRESPVETEETTPESVIDEQLLTEEPLKHTPVQTRHENSTVQPRTNGILGSISDHSGLNSPRDDSRNSKPLGKYVALEEPTYENGIQGCPAEEAIRYSLVLTDQTGKYTSRGPLNIATTPFNSTQTRI
ncbi:hypothetical protein SEVIR_3G281800v4 [Setaria viridis]|uniref:Uncharacterized protein n=1 Tax=Setaria viridis TaxID=4556 RepID=A0A4U6VJU5_SETVI|nr:disease resistance protein RGA4-like [Setaria viridis]TKW27809.1 hypothetical protein SEVIR_3G281800v2 [Setaria viridis]